MEGLYYQHSGKFSLGGVAFALVVGSVIACFLAFVYAYLILYIPLVYINFLITAGFGAVVGIAAAALLKNRKVRNGGVAMVTALLITAIAYYYAWVSWLWALGRRYGDAGEVTTSVFFGLLLQPAEVWKAILTVNENGAWSFRSGDPVTGGVLWGVWALEALIIFGASLLIAKGWMEAEPFCENCEVWCESKENVLAATTQNVEEFKQRMEAKDFRYLESLGAPAAECADWQQIDLYTCPKCMNTNTLSAKRVVLKVEKKETKKEESDILKHLVLSVSEADTVKKLGEKMQAPGEPKAAAAGAS